MRRKIGARYGYDTYGGNCHMFPNHALVVHALLHGGDDFQRSLMIVNTCGWDTDCNSGNVGCLLGIKNGLPTIDAGPDWRGPVADRMYPPTAEAYEVVNIGRALAGKGPVVPKNGARFHFELPGSVQGFRPEETDGFGSPVRAENARGHSRDGGRSLAVRYDHVAPGRPARVSTPTFVPPEAINMPDYALLASPTLYPGQTVRARLSADGANGETVTCRLVVSVFDGNDELTTVCGPGAELEPGAEHELGWLVEETGGQPIAAVGVEVSPGPAVSGSVYLDYLTWDGEPDVALTRPAGGGSMWRRAWVNAVDRLDPFWPEPYRLLQNRGTGLIIQGTREWKDYGVTAAVRPHLALRAGVAARVQGLRRYYALVLAVEGKARLVKELDGTTVLAEKDYDWRLNQTYEMGLEAEGNRLRASIDGEALFEVEDDDGHLMDNSVALLCEEGRVDSEVVRVRPL